MPRYMNKSMKKQKEKFCTVIGWETLEKVYWNVGEVSLYLGGGGVPVLLHSLQMWKGLCFQKAIYVWMRVVSLVMDDKLLEAYRQKQTSKPKGSSKSFLLYHETCMLWTWFTYWEFVFEMYLFMFESGIKFLLGLPAKCYRSCVMIYSFVFFSCPECTLVSVYTGCVVIVLVHCL